MIIKTFVTNDMKEALTRAKYELGMDAVLVSNRIVRVRSWFNPIGKRMVEATFAMKEKFETTPIHHPGGNKIGGTNTQALPFEKELQMEPALPEDVIQEIGSDPLFAHAGLQTKKRLESYLKLHNKIDGTLDSQERKEFFNIIVKGSSFNGYSDNGRIKILVGPTGVGKTTTVAKIAANELLGKGKKVGILTIDTYRIGAVEQLRTYADILGVPFYVVRSPEEMEEKLKLLEDCDLILVDTLGTSPKDMKKQVEIKKSIHAIKEEADTYLVVSLSTDLEILRSTLERYKILKYDALVVTKVDEMETTKNLWHLIETNLVPVKYFCHGQEVPDDIKEATSNHLFQYIEENFNHDRSGWKITNFG